MLHKVTNYKKIIIMKALLNKLLNIIKPNNTTIDTIKEKLNTLLNDENMYNKLNLDELTNLGGDYIIQKQFRFEAAHRVWKQDLSNSRGCEFTPNNTENRCTNIHGHSYKVIVKFIAFDLDRQDMVMDFYHVKFMLHKLIDSFDHAFLIDRNDPMYNDFMELVQKYNINRVVTLDFHPTSENLARYIYKYCQDLLETEKIYGVQVYSVQVFETETGAATYIE